MNGPKWLREVNPNSCISSREFAKIIGVKSTAAIANRLSAGTIPKPDWIRKERNDHGKAYAYYWRVRTVLQWLETAQLVVTEKDGEIKTKLV